jgi:hydrogenase nickel incorporation protein HypB
MVNRALAGLDLAGLDLVIAENVGNLVCPAEFDVGEHAKVMVYSITEGEDKLKYPVMFRSVDVVLLNKIDLEPHSMPTSRPTSTTCTRSTLKPSCYPSSP